MKFTDILKTINTSYDSVLARQLTDAALRDTYQKAPSMTRIVEKVFLILHKCKIQNKHNIVNKLVNEFVPPGTKAAIKGNRLNHLIRKRILKQKRKHCTVTFEETPLRLKGIIHEKPDWVFQNTLTDKILVGYNQTTLWGGGHQLNRAAKYILDESLHRKLASRNAELVCLVVEKPPLTSSESKTNRIIKHGIMKKRLILPRSLRSRLIAATAKL